MRSMSRQQAARLVNTARRTQSRQNSTTSASSSSSNTTQIRAAMLIHRAPLLTPLPTPFESSFYNYASSIQLALSNPVPTEFYFKKGSLNERRFQKLQWSKEREVFGERIAGKEVDVGELPVEEDFGLNERIAEEEEEFLTAQDLEASGSASNPGAPSDPSSSPSSAPTAPAHKIHRRGSSHLYLMTKSPGSSSWSLPSVSIPSPSNTGQDPAHSSSAGSSSSSQSSSTLSPSSTATSSSSSTSVPEPLHEAASKNVAEHLGSDMDLWLVTRKPVGLIRDGGVQTFIFKSHILAGAPNPTSTTSPTEYAWLTKSEIKALLLPSGSGSSSNRTDEEQSDEQERLLQHRKEGIVIREDGGIWDQLEMLLNE